MFIKMLKREIGSNKAINVTLCLFIVISTMLVAAAFNIMSDVSTSMNKFFEDSKPPHYLQMVAGDIDQRAIEHFADTSDSVENHQVQTLLGIDNSYIFYGDDPEPYSDSAMENIFVKQNPDFDLLLDESNTPLTVSDGEVAIPYYAMESYGVEVGDTITIKHGDFIKGFKVKGMLRDSQMNPSLISSKRFLVNESVLNALKAHTGEIEYLIEFQLNNPDMSGEFENEYLDAGLPSGIAITLPMTKMITAFTCGLPSVILILASILLIIISMVCLRFTILSTLEDEYCEIGVMKAIGLLPIQIRRLYLIKYYILGGISCIIGLILSYFLSGFFSENISRYMGSIDFSFLKILFPMLGAFIVFALVVGFTRLVFRRLKKVSVVSAIRGEDNAGYKQRTAFSIQRKGLININIYLGLRDIPNRLRSYAVLIVVYAICAFMIIVPANFANTINSEEFTGYTGMGFSDAVIDLRYSDDIDDRYANILETLDKDEDVKKYKGYVTANYKVENPDGEYENLVVRNGDRASYPIPYTEGRAPQNEEELALSLLNAQNLEKKIGDTIKVILNEKARALTVTGIYQDLTNGGKSAQGSLPYDDAPVLWYTIQFDVSDGVKIEDKISEYKEVYGPAKILDIQSYKDQTFASTIKQFDSVRIALTAIAIFLAILVTALYMRLTLSKDKVQISIKKGLGFTDSNIRTQYITSTIGTLLIGIILGVLGSATLGEMLVGLLMSNMGIANISFVVNPLMAYFMYPALLLAVISITCIIACRSIQKNRNFIITE